MNSTFEKCKGPLGKYWGTHASIIGAILGEVPKHSVFIRCRYASSVLQRIHLFDITRTSVGGHFVTEAVDVLQGLGRVSRTTDFTLKCRKSRYIEIKK